MLITSSLNIQILEIPSPLELESFAEISLSTNNIVYWWWRLLFLNLSTECCHAAGIIVPECSLLLHRSFGWLSFSLIIHNMRMTSHTNDTKWNWMTRFRAKRLKSSVMHNEARYIKQFQLPKDLLLCCCLSHNIHREWNVDDEERCESHFHITAFDVSEKKRGSAYHPMYIFNAEEYEWRSRRKVWVKSRERVSACERGIKINFSGFLLKCLLTFLSYSALYCRLRGLNEMLNFTIMTAKCFAVFLRLAVSFSGERANHVISLTRRKK